MSALNDADFGSDTDDDDYKPEGEVHDASEEENSGEDENTELEGGAVKTKKKKRGKAKKVANGRKNIFESDEDKVDWQGELERRSRRRLRRRRSRKLMISGLHSRRTHHPTNHQLPRKLVQSPVYLIQLLQVNQNLPNLRLPSPPTDLPHSLMIFRNQQTRQERHLNMRRRRNQKAC